MDDLDEVVWKFIIDIENLEKEMKNYVKEKKFVKAGDLQSKIKALQDELEPKESSLLEKRKTQIEDVIVTDMKAGWKVPLESQHLDLSDKFTRKDGTISVGTAIDRTKTGQIATPREFYVMSSRTNTYHTLEVKYFDVGGGGSGGGGGSDSTPQNIRQLENDITNLEEQMDQFVEDRDFVNAQKMQEQIQEKKQLILGLQSDNDRTPLGAANIRQLEHDVAELEKEIDEAAASRNYVKASQLQKELNKKKELLAEKKKNKNLESENELEGLNIRALETEIAALTEKIAQCTLEMKAAAKQKNFTLAGEKQKEVNEAEKEKKKLEQLYQSKLNSTNDDEVEIEGPSIRQLENEHADLGTELKEAVDKRDFGRAGEIQIKMKAKLKEIEDAKGKMGSDGPAPNIRQMESQIAELEKKMQEHVNKQQFSEAGSYQKKINDLVAKLVEVKKNLNLPLND